MSTAIQALSVLLPVGYLAVVLAHAPGAAWGNVAVRRTLLAVVLLAHASLFAVHSAAVGSFPFLTGWLAVSAVAMTVGVLDCWIAFRAHHGGTTSIVFGFVFAMQLLASAFGPVEPGPARAGSPILAFHTLASLAACAPLILSGIHGALYLVLYRMMRNRRFGAFFASLPDLGLLARMTRGAAFAGFLLLGLGVNLGIAWAHSAGVAGFSYRDPFVLVMLAIWLHFGVVAFSRRIPGLTAWRASFAATTGFCVLPASLLVTVLLPLSFHWNR